MTGDYEYDVFLSYHRHAGKIRPWIRNVLSYLDIWLTEEMGGERQRIFFDEESIPVGSRWPDKIQAALRRSRCMVGIWSPSYFRHGWCLSEWRSFLLRQQHLKVEELILPIRFHDGESFPPEAQQVQMFDLTRYSFVSPSFWTSKRIWRLEGEMKSFSVRLASALRKAPQFEDNFPIQESDNEPGPPILFPRY